MTKTEHHEFSLIERTCDEIRRDNIDLRAEIQSLHHQWNELMYVLLGEYEALANSNCKYQRKEGRCLGAIMKKLREYKHITNQ